MRVRVQVVIESGDTAPITTEIAQIERPELTFNYPHFRRPS